LTLLEPIAFWCPKDRVDGLLQHVDLDSPQDIDHLLVIPTLGGSVEIGQQAGRKKTFTHCRVREVWGDG
jgi:hypothetical protein